MAFNARNSLPGRVTAIKLRGVMAEVTVDIGGGDDVLVVIEATEVLLATSEA